MAAVATLIGDPVAQDWPGRYDHIDQVLNRPGPRTDESFLAGEGVS